MAAFGADPLQTRAAKEKMEMKTEKLLQPLFKPEHRSQEYNRYSCGRPDCREHFIIYAATQGTAREKSCFGTDPFDQSTLPAFMKPLQPAENPVLSLDFRRSVLIRLLSVMCVPLTLHKLHVCKDSFEG